jgi:hypothetical protein
MEREIEVRETKRQIQRWLATARDGNAEAAASSSVFRGAMLVATGLIFCGLLDETERHGGLFGSRQVGRLRLRGAKVKQY